MADTPTRTQQFPRVVFVTINFNGGGVAGDDSKSGKAPASKASIEAMPRIKVKESGGDCSICLEEFEVDEEAREMPCKNVFHSGCIEKWLQIHGSCPACRFFMPAAETAETNGGEGGRRRLEGGENINGLDVFESFLALASFMGMMGSGWVFHQPNSGWVNDNMSSNQNMDRN
ncbi:putative Ribosomal protein L34e superfamily protein [Hibiscus syriacus]|uniref:RING-type E3 ubiquitin transferase n=1 Tax=Hibiscus syriacus TaxID=106335 RepID=A0A6A2WW53_HIBSY|nr:E3 ubiquitin-protein ligase MPSR1-like [Hibiscus syriacus]KAE8659505.1 putative Ribosomal protein L34e superfamily protein [Hibiscus syriacus]